MNKRELQSAILAATKGLQHHEEVEPAMLKYAHEHGLSSAQLERMGHLFNASKTVAILDSNPGNRGIGFKLLDTENMVRKYAAECERREAKRLKTAADYIPDNGGFVVLDKFSLNLLDDGNVDVFVPSFDNFKVASETVIEHRVGDEMVARRREDETIRDIVREFDELMEKRASLHGEGVRAIDEALKKWFQSYRHDDPSFFPVIEEDTFKIASQFMPEEKVRECLDIIAEDWSGYRGAVIRRWDGRPTIKMAYDRTGIAENLAKGLLSISEGEALEEDIRTNIPQEFLRKYAGVQGVFNFNDPTLQYDIDQLRLLTAKAEQEAANNKMLREQAAYNFEQQRIAQEQQALNDRLQYELDAARDAAIKAQADAQRAQFDAQRAQAEQIAQQRRDAIEKARQQKQQQLDKDKEDLELENTAYKNYDSWINRDKIVEDKIKEEKTKAQNELIEKKKQKRILDEARDKSIKEKIDIGEKAVTGVFNVGKMQANMLFDAANQLNDIYTEKRYKIDEKVNKSLYRDKLVTDLAELQLRDPIISQHDPKKVAEFAETLISAAPNVMSDRNLMRLALREALAYESIPIHTMASIIEMEEKKNKAVNLDFSNKEIARPRERSGPVTIAQPTSTSPKENKNR
jgi:hypothetical protein